MKAGLDSALHDVLHQMNAGKSLEQCLEGYTPEIAGELRALVEITSAIRTLQTTAAPSSEARAANRRRFLTQAAAIREERVTATTGARGVWRQMREILSRSTWREAMYAASLTLALGLLMLAGATRGMNWIQLPGRDAPSVTHIVRVEETPAPSPSIIPSQELATRVLPEMTRAPESSGTRAAQAAPDTATPLPTLDATPIVASTATESAKLAITASPSPAVVVVSPAPTATAKPATPAPSATRIIVPPSPTATRTPSPRTPTTIPTATPLPATPTRTAAPATPTKASVLPSPTATWTDEPPEPTDTPEEPTATFTSAPPTNTPTLRPTLPPTPVETTQHPEPTLVLTIVPAAQPTVTPPR